MTKMLHEYSENVDIYLSDNNETVHYLDDTHKTSIDFAPFVVFEDKRSPQFRFKIRAALKLPRTSKRLKVSFKDYSASDSIDDYGSRTGQNGDNNYLLGLEYFSFDKNLASLSFSGGIKTNHGKLDPYLSFKFRKYIYINEWRLTLTEKLSYFAYLHVDNRINVNLGYFMDKDTKVRFLNSYRYRDDESTHELTNTMQVHRLLSDKKNIYADFNIYSLQNDSQKFDVSYYKLGFNFHHKFY
ncbi:MAG: hypothetical protein U9P71_07970, partial [Campylobacterota bacterium]|nr:hypothetical protein [Campylobacterota bacterium]